MAWENAYQLKLWRKHFFASCYRLITRKALRIWRQRVSDSKLTAAVETLAGIHSRYMLRRSV